MELQEDTSAGRYKIQAYKPGEITINAKTYTQSLIVSAEQLIGDWAPQSLQALDDTCWSDVLAIAPEIVLVGTGLTFSFPSPQTLRPLYEAHIGVESMDTGAACRTFMALLSEGRHVVAALLIK